MMLRELFLRLCMIEPTADGYAVSADEYVEAIHFMTLINPKIALLSSKELMDKTGVTNTMFVGHFIYPGIAE